MKSRRKRNAIAKMDKKKIPLIGEAIQKKEKQDKRSKVFPSELSCKQDLGYRNVNRS